MWCNRNRTASHYKKMMGVAGAWDHYTKILAFAKAFRVEIMPALVSTAHRRITTDPKNPVKYVFGKVPLPIEVRDCCREIHQMPIDQRGRGRLPFQQHVRSYVHVASLFGLTPSVLKRYVHERGYHVRRGSDSGASESSRAMVG